MKEIVITAELIKEEEGGYTVYSPELDIYTLTFPIPVHKGKIIKPGTLK